MIIDDKIASRFVPPHHPSATTFASGDVGSKPPTRDDEGGGVVGSGDEKDDSLAVPKDDDLKPKGRNDYELLTLAKELGLKPTRARKSMTPEGLKKMLLSYDEPSEPTATRSNGVRNLPPKPTRIHTGPAQDKPSSTSNVEVFRKNLIRELLPYLRNLSSAIAVLWDDNNRKVAQFGLTGQFSIKELILMVNKGQTYFADVSDDPLLDDIRATETTILIFYGLLNNFARKAERTIEAYERIEGDSQFNGRGYDAEVAESIRAIPELIGNLNILLKGGKVTDNQGATKPVKSFNVWFGYEKYDVYGNLDKYDDVVRLKNSEQEMLTIIGHPSLLYRVLEILEGLKLTGEFVNAMR